MIRSMCEGSPEENPKGSNFLPAQVSRSQQVIAHLVNTSGGNKSVNCEPISVLWAKEEVLIAQKFHRAGDIQNCAISTKSGTGRRGQSGAISISGSIFATLVAKYSFYF